MTDITSAPCHPTRVATAIAKELGVPPRIGRLIVNDNHVGVAACAGEREIAAFGYASAAGHDLSLVRGERVVATLVLSETVVSLIEAHRAPTLDVGGIAGLAQGPAIAFVPDLTLDELCRTVALAIDPAVLGEEPHLRGDVDACGLDDDALNALERTLWAERARREDRRRSDTVPQMAGRMAA